MPETDASTNRTGGNDAVCFTAGQTGAAFGAGVIHAWLAADRKPPEIAAGISIGALSSVAMQKCYRELERAPQDSLERGRWGWFRRYLNAVADHPLEPLWKAIPDPVDFFADKPPVKDLSAATLPDDLRSQEPAARRHYFILTKLGIWLAGLPLRVSTVASIAVQFVRWKERYPFRTISFLLLAVNVVKSILGVWWHLVRAPRFFWEASFSGKYRFRPLFGWPIWLANLLPALLGLVWLCFSVYRLDPLTFEAVYTSPAVYASLLFPVVPFVLLVSAVFAIPDSRWLMAKYLCKPVDIAQGLLDQFELKRRLYDLFGDETLAPVQLANQAGEMRVLVVCAALQRAEQVWFRSKTRATEALSAALAIPGIFPPSQPSAAILDNYKPGRLKPQLVDGVVVRSNPITALFQWCQNNPQIARKLQRENTPSLHVVYSVPVRPEVSVAEAPPPASIDIVKTAITSLKLEKRRDTRQEVVQTNFISQLEGVRRAICKSEQLSERPSFQIFADEIAPPGDLSFKNGWQPTRVESLKITAQGCRRCLEALYRDEIKQRGAPVECAVLLQSIAPRRKSVIDPMAPGVTEICQECTRRLEYRPWTLNVGPPPGVVRSYGMASNKLRAEFTHLRRDQPALSGSRVNPPRIVFLGSGGVFRGAFHIGVIAAMQATRVFPDLVVGASVGALMGGALANIAVAPTGVESQILANLANTFLSVDEKVALTRTLKNALKQFGVRARQISLSPAQLRKMVLRGSQADPGYAATGAPPALIDAISQIFMIPHRCTGRIASDFVAGHISHAIHSFFTEIRRETLPSFDIVQALMGTSLLEGVARELLGQGARHVDLQNVQPYHRPAPGKRPVSVFCTTSFLNAHISLLLGRDFMTSEPTWDGVFAGLSSSAFPAVFCPRNEAELLPGRGRSDRFFSDGGLFDNLPFIPAIEILSAMQSDPSSSDLCSVLERVEKRIKNRDIIIAAGLNEAATPVDTEFDTWFKIRARAATLSAESKVKSFVGASERVQATLSEIAGCAKDCATLAGAQYTAPFLDGNVAAAVIKITPTDKDHINGTFAFCRSAGLEKDKVRKSIADGCFRTLGAFADSYNRDPTTHGAFAATRVKFLKARLDLRVPASDCPYFEIGGKRLDCPFSATKDPSLIQIRSVCAKDKLHR